MGPDIMVFPALMDITAALMDTIPALNNAYQTHPNCEYGETYRCNYPAYGGYYYGW
jgi:hypothetical protein